MQPTYDQFLDELNKSGIKMSDYDMALAKENPAAGYGILNAKTNWINATTPEAQQSAWEAAESWRKTGGYSGGMDGSMYNPIQTQTSQNPYINMTATQLMNYGGKEPSLDEVRRQYNLLDNYKPFSYDVNTDPLYQNYKDQYTRNGQMAMQDTLGQVSARTGGLASSYAGTAAQQSYNQYMQALSDKIPDLYQLAYQQYADQYNRRQNVFNNALNIYGAEADAYNNNRNALFSQVDMLAGLDNAAYERQQAGQADARNRINAFLAAGGDVSRLPADLLSASGLTAQELAAYGNAAGGKGGYGTGAGNLIDYDQMVGKNLVGISRDNPGLALALLGDWDNLGYTEKFSLLQNAGYDNDTAIALAPLSSGQFSAYVGSTQQSNDLASILAQMASQDAPIDEMVAVAEGLKNEGDEKVSLPGVLGKLFGKKN